MGPRYPQCLIDLFTSPSYVLISAFDTQHEREEEADALPESAFQSSQSSQKLSISHGSTASSSSLRGR